MAVSPVTQRKPTKKAEQRAEMTEQILDAAEFLFSEHGLHGVALKDVAQRVGVHHTLMNYYFTDKKKLFDAVFARRADVTRNLRLAALEAYEKASAGKPTVEGALRAFLDTDLNLYSQGDEGWRNYGRLGALAANAPWGAQLFDQHFDVVVMKLIGLLKRALPECDETDIFWGYHFVSGALFLTLARSGRLDKLSDGKCQSDDFEAARLRMASFMAGGFVELCRSRASARAAAASATATKRSKTLPPPRRAKTTR